MNNKLLLLLAVFTTTGCMADTPTIDEFVNDDALYKQYQERCKTHDFTKAGTDPLCDNWAKASDRRFFATPKEVQQPSGDKKPGIGMNTASATPKGFGTKSYFTDEITQWLQAECGYKANKTRLSMNSQFQTFYNSVRGKSYEEYLVAKKSLSCDNFDESSLKSMW